MFKSLLKGFSLVVYGISDQLENGLISPLVEAIHKLPPPIHEGPDRILKLPLSFGTPNDVSKRTNWLKTGRSLANLRTDFQSLMAMQKK